MMRLSERREASGSQPDTRPGQLRMAQAQHGGWSLEAKGRSAGTAGHADPGDLQTQATARLGGPGEQRAPHLPPPGCQGDSEASDCPGGHAALGSARRLFRTACKGAFILSDLVSMVFGIVVVLFA